MPNPLTTPLIPQSWTDAANAWAQPGLNTSPTSAMLKGFGAGALQGLRSLSTPLSIAGMVAPGVGDAIAPAEAAGSLMQVAGPTMDLVEPASVAQSLPSMGDTDALIGQMKYNLAKIPNSASAAVQGLNSAAGAGEAMGTSAAGANDLMNPGALGRMDDMYQQANPVFKQLQQQGLFSGPRTNPLPPLAGGIQ